MFRRGVSFCRRARTFRRVPRTLHGVIAALAATGAALVIPAGTVEAADFPGANGITVSVNPYPLLTRTDPGSPGFTLSVADTNPNGVSFDAYYLGRVPTGWEVRVNGGPIAPFVSNPDGTSVFELPRAAAAAGQVSVLPPIGFQGDPPFTLSRTSPDSPNTIVQFDGGTFDFDGDATPRLNDGPGGGDTDHDYKDPTEPDSELRYPPNDGQYTIWVTSRISGPDDPYDAFGWSDLRSVDDPLGGYGDLCDGFEAVDENDAEDAGKFLIFNADDGATPPNRFVEFDVDLEAGHIYDFSAFLANVSEPGGILPNVLFDINPPGAGNTSPLVASGNLPRPDECDLDSSDWWQRFGAVFYAPVSGSYELGLTNFAPGGGGNDLGIDNLSLREMETVDFTASVVAPAELSVTKVASDTSPDFGTNVTYTLTVSNTGVGDAGGAVVVDQLPAGLQYISHAGPGTYDSASGQWTIPTVAAGGSAVLTITARVTGTTPIVNTVTSMSAPQDPTPCTSNCASVTVTPQMAILAVGKSVSNETPAYGTDVTFTITVNNTGTANATGVSVVDQLPPGLAYVGDTGPGSYNSANGTWNGFSVAAGGSASLSLVARVQSPTAVTNRVTSLSSPQDPTSCTSNCAAATVTAELAALTATKSVSDPAPVFGSTVTYTVDVTNGGDTTATAVNLVDRLPAGLEYVSHTAEVGTYAPATGAWSGFDLAVDDTATLTVVARVITGDNVANTVTALASPQDPTPCNAACASAPVDPRTAEISVTKTVDDPTPVYLDEVTFTLIATNSGDADATVVSASDPLPAGLQYVSHVVDAGTYDSVSGLWTGFGLAAGGGAAQLQITAQVIDPTDVTNEVVEVGAPEDPSLCEAECGSATVEPRTADIVVTKMVDEPSPAYSHDVIFTITATNEGDADATGVELLDQLPPGLTYVAHSGDGTYDSVTGTWTVGALAIDATATLQLTAEVRTTEPVDNTVTAVIAAEDPAPCETGCTLSAGIEPRMAALSITKVVDVSDPVFSRTATFTIEASNSGDADATGVRITDLLPAGLVHVSDDGAGTYDPVTGTWAIPVLAVDATVSLEITARIETADPVTNGITVVAPEDPAPCAEECDLEETITPRSADLAATIDADELRPIYGDQVALTVEVTNAGDADATDVAVDVPLPAGLQYVSDGSGGAYAAATGRWSVGALPATDGSARFTITARVVSGSDIPVVVTRVAAPEEPEPCTSDCATVGLDPRRAELAATLTANDSAPVFSTNVTFTLTITNHGDTGATGASATNLLPAGVAYVSHSGPGTYDPASGVWNIGDLGASCDAVPDATGDQPPACVAAPTALSTATPAAVNLSAPPPAAAALTVTATVQTTDAVTNAVSALAAAEDPTPCSGVCASVVVDARNAELQVSKVVDRAAAEVGDSITYTITVRNVGNGDATGVVVSDQLPAGLEYVSDDSGGAFDPGTGAWQVGTVAAGGTRALQLVTRVLASGTIVNTVSLAGGTEDPTPCGASCASVQVLSSVGEIELPATGADAPSVMTTALAMLSVGVLLAHRARRRALN